MPLEESDPLSSVEFPNYSELQKNLNNLIIANFWNDGDVNPSREVFRPAFRRKNGAGSNFNMPLAASWLSSGPGASSKETNIVAFPKGVDETFLAYMRSIGVLGEHDAIDFEDFPRIAVETRRKIYNVDDFTDDWDDISVNSARTLRYVNTKKYLRELSSYAAPDTIVDLRKTTVHDFFAVGKGDTVYVKKNNTENTGNGVLICKTADQYEAIVQELLSEAKEHHLDFDIVLQSRIEGTNRSFQYFMTPDQPKSIGMMALSYQHIEKDGKTYAGSDNVPVSAENVDANLAAMMLDMATKLRALDSKVFGFVMCDYFETKDGLLAFDPGLRPTGNTATALARMFMEEQMREPHLLSSLTFIPSARPETSFKNYTKPIDALMGPDAFVKEESCVLPWGYNHLQGNGLFIGIGKTQEKLQAVLAEVSRTLLSHNV